MIPDRFHYRHTVGGGHESVGRLAFVLGCVLVAIGSATVVATPLV